MTIAQMTNSVRNVVRADDPAERKVQTNSRLYFLIGFLSPIATAFDTTAKYDYYPSVPKLVAAMLLGAIAGLTAVRAFRDGSYTLHEQSKESAAVTPPVVPV